MVKKAIKDWSLDKWAKDMEEIFAEEGLTDQEHFKQSVSDDVKLKQRRARAKVFQKYGSIFSILRDFYFEYG